MYRVQGADQKEYGPISAEQVHQWIQENRLNRFSLAERDGDPGWKPLEQFPEFAGALGPPPSGLGPTATGGLPARDAVLVPDPQAAGRTLKAPAITLIFFAIAGMVFAVSGLFLKGFFMGTWIQLIEQMNLPLDDNARAQLQAAATAGIGIFDVVQVLVGIGLNVVMLIGALKMMKLESWGLAFAAAILVMLPCGSCCCCLGIPLGVWLIVLLNKPEIKTAFR
jgi:hypothetical protein